MPAPMTCDISNHNNNGIILLVFCHLLRQAWYFVFYMDFHFYMVYRDSKEELDWVGSHFWHGDITKLISDWTSVSCWHYLQEIPATSNVQLIFFKHSQFIPYCPLTTHNYDKHDAPGPTSLCLSYGLFGIFFIWESLY